MNMEPRKYAPVLMFVLLAAQVCLAAPCYANPETGRLVVVSELEGELFYKSAGSDAWVPLGLNDPVGEHDTVKTGPNSTARLTFKGQADSVVDLRPQSELEIVLVGRVDQDDDTELNLLIGAILVKAEKLKGNSSFEVHTPTSIVGIRGTEFEVTVE